MIGFLAGYSVGKSRSRARARRDALPYGYGELEFMAIMSALVIGAIWPIHFGLVLRKWGLHVAWAIAIATVLGIIGLAIGWGYVAIGILYSGIWLGVLIVRGVEEEQRAENIRDDDSRET